MCLAIVTQETPFAEYTRRLCPHDGVDPYTVRLDFYRQAGLLGRYCAQVKIAEENLDWHKNEVPLEDALAAVELMHNEYVFFKSDSVRPNEHDNWPQVATYPDEMRHPLVSYIAALIYDVMVSVTGPALSGDKQKDILGIKKALIRILNNPESLHCTQAKLVPLLFAEIWREIFAEMLEQESNTIYLCRLREFSPMLCLPVSRKRNINGLLAPSYRSYPLKGVRTSTMITSRAWM